MVNHFRTTLLDLAPAVSVGPGEEYVPPDYKPASAGRNLTDARSALFGPGVDRAGYNLTAARIIAYLATSQFAADTVRDDARLTYDRFRPLDVWQSLGAAFTTTAGDDPVGWSGVAAFRSAGRAYGEWDAVTDGAGGYTVTPQGGQVTSGSVATSDLGDVVPLPGSTLGLVVATGSAGRWRVTLLTPPAHSWSSAAATEATGVFNPQASEDEAAWFAAWSDPFAPAPLRAAVLALAVAARTSESVLAREAG